MLKLSHAVIESYNHIHKVMTSVGLDTMLGTLIFPARDFLSGPLIMVNPLIYPSIVFTH